MEQQTASKFDKKYFKAVYCYFAYLAYMQCTSRKMLDWVKHKLDCSTPGLPVHHQLLEFTQTHVHRVGDAIQLSHPLFRSPPAFNLFQHQGLFKWVSCIRWPKYCSFSFNIGPSNEHSGLISFRMDWLDLLAAQGTFKSLLHTTVQNHQFFGA